MLLAFFIIINPRQKQLPLIILQRRHLTPLLNLGDGSFRALIPFQLDHRLRFVYIQFPGDQTDIHKAFSVGQFSDTGIVFSREIKIQIDCTTEGVFVIILQNGYFFMSPVNACSHGFSIHVPQNFFRISHGAPEPRSP